MDKEKIVFAMAQLDGWHLEGGDAGRNIVRPDGAYMARFVTVRDAAGKELRVRNNVVVEDRWVGRRDDGTSGATLYPDYLRDRDAVIAVVQKQVPSVQERWVKTLSGLTINGPQSTHLDVATAPAHLMSEALLRITGFWEEE